MYFYIYIYSRLFTSIYLFIYIYTRMKYRIYIPICGGCSKFWFPNQVSMPVVGSYRPRWVSNIGKSPLFGQQ